ncbi:hypothetical protein [Acinetobacter puyangensis]|uniref:hypothetical protein n=1 Tax=Acinetobacter puyangensis TaxID=1096779 RepID=UPI003A4DA4EB
MITQMSVMNEWKLLNRRYGSNRQYERRKVLSSPIHFHDFVEWLIDQGAEISTKPKQDEALRFYLNGKLGIVYTKGSGSLLAHDLGIKYQKSIGEEIPKNHHMLCSFDLGIYA